MHQLLLLLLLLLLLASVLLLIDTNTTRHTYAIYEMNAAALLLLHNIFIIQPSGFKRLQFTTVWNNCYS